MSESALLSIEVEFPGPRGGTKKRTLKFKSLTEVPIGIVRETRRDFDEQMWRVFEWAFTADDLAAFDELPSAKVLDILRQMQAASKIELGESSASSES